MILIATNGTSYKIVDEFLKLPKETVIESLNKNIAIKEEIKKEANFKEGLQNNVNSNSTIFSVNSSNERLLMK